MSPRPNRTPLAAACVLALWAVLPPAHATAQHFVPPAARVSSDMKLPGECSGKAEAISRVRLIFDAEERVKER